MFVKQIFGKNRRKRAGSPVSLTSGSSFSLTSDYSLDTRSLQVVQDVDAGQQPANDTTPAPSDATPADGDPSPAANTAASSAGGATTRAAGEPAPRHIMVPMSGRRSREPSSLSTYDDDSYKTRDRRERDSAMIQLLQKTRTPRKLAFPSKYPAYLKEPPGLSYEETAASVRRRLHNEKRLKAAKEVPSLKKDQRKLVAFVSPKSNKTLELRSLYIRRQPLVSQYFSDHYNRFHKPPFRFANARPCH